jgi:hypothetical protein
MEKYLPVGNNGPDWVAELMNVRISAENGPP